MNELEVDWIREMIAAIQFGMYLSFSYLGIWGLNIQKCNSTCWFIWTWNLVVV
jgi:hypothetical protein